MKAKYLALLAFALCAFSAAAAQAATHHQVRPHQQVRIADSDRDSASNRCERQADLRTHRRDSDRDGRIDGREDSDRDGANNAAESLLRTNCDNDTDRFEIDDAEIVSFNEQDGLTLKVGGRGLLTAPLATDLVCEQELSDDAVTSRDDEDDDDADDDADDEADDDADEDAGDEADDDATAPCTGADLTAGREVDEAVIRGGNFVRIELDELDDEDDD